MDRHYAIIKKMQNVCNYMEYYTLCNIDGVLPYSTDSYTKLFAWVCIHSQMNPNLSISEVIIRFDSAKPKITITEYPVGSKDVPAPFYKEEIKPCGTCGGGKII